MAEMLGLSAVGDTNLSEVGSGEKENKGIGGSSRVSGCLGGSCF